MIESTPEAYQPIILHANRIQLAGHPVIRNGPVGSRMLLRCLDGAGRVRINGELHDLRAGDWRFLPWRHTIHYFAETSRSFWLEGIHLVPDLPRGAEQPVRFSIPHHAAEPLATAAERRDAALPGLDGVVGGRFVPNSRFDHLCAYVVDLFSEDPPAETMARHLAAIFCAELRHQRQAPEGQPLPPTLDRLLARLRTNLAQPRTIAGLARDASCSPATLNRLFRRHLGRSPVDWLLNERIAAAERLLAGTADAVAAIGRQVGFRDASYFSRLFRQRRGESVRAFRARRAPGFH